MTNWVKKFFGPRPPPTKQKLYVDAEPVLAETIDALQARIDRLERFRPLLKDRELLGELLEEVMVQPMRDLADPLVVQESGQFYRGALWLTGTLGGKLDVLETEIAQKQKTLFELKKQQQRVFTPQGG